MSIVQEVSHPKIAEAQAILTAVGMPRGQQNARTALVLLALAGMRKTSRWSEASASNRLGITEMMEWMREAYDKHYAPNSRETVRRFSVHQMIAAGLIRQNAGRALPINSPDNRYALSPDFVKVLRAYRTPSWSRTLARFLAAQPALKDRYARERDLRRIPVTIRTARGRTTIRLSAGGQNPLIRDIIEGFAPCFTPGALVAYVGDTGAKQVHHDRKLLASIGIVVDDHGKMPDVILLHRHSATERWLVLVEAVTSHGPMSPKRVSELDALFAGCHLGKVFVTAFADQKTMVRHARDIAWETEVWIAEHPTHLIHFNGDRFLGPHGPGAPTAAASRARPPRRPAQAARGRGRAGAG